LKSDIVRVYPDAERGEAEGSPAPSGKTGFLPVCTGDPSLRSG
jgi:hypothetical protein